MRVFRCDNCEQLLFFENSKCLHCGTEVGFVASKLDLVALEGDHGTPLPRCENEFIARCNWVVEDPEDTLCLSCKTTTVRPADDDHEALEAYAKAETAKRRVLYQLLDIRLPVNDDTLDFQLRSSEHEPVMTGHDDGTITLDLAETDDAHREQRREDLGEPYRTLLGHFRHELGHYYQGIILLTDADWNRCRAVFGDERASYQAALDRHYAEGAPANWQDNFVSAYATMHPWEDWAETFAHYLHIRDTLQTAANFGMTVEGPRALEGDAEFVATPDEANAHRSFDSMLDNWLPLTYALNQLNRSMGRGDLYPFTLAPPVIDKLAFVHTLVKAAVRPDAIAATNAAAASPEPEAGIAEAEATSTATGPEQTQTQTQTQT